MIMSLPHDDATFEPVVPVAWTIPTLQRGAATSATATNAGRQPKSAGDAASATHLRAIEPVGLDIATSF